eukprot:GEMP01068061.1.p1 GENE.GEMP01068061.1~~GEMP01068061.1.p1  ORF type:complete len:217 (+),score=30.94 GEMP01068061.1:15-665(+)
MMDRAEVLPVRMLRVENLTGKAIRAILYNTSDKLQWIPLGGIAGPGVAFIEPGEIGVLDFPSKLDTAKLKIFNPLIVDCPMDSRLVSAGEFVQYTGQGNLEKANAATATVGAGALGLTVGTLVLGPIVGILAAGAAVWAASQGNEVGAVTKSVGQQVASSTMAAKDSVVQACSAEPVQQASRTVQSYAESFARRVTRGNSPENRASYEVIGASDRG